MEEERKSREQSEAKAKARANDTTTSPSTEGHEECIRERCQVNHHLSFLLAFLLESRVTESGSLTLLLACLRQARRDYKTNLGGERQGEARTLGVRSQAQGQERLHRSSQGIHSLAIDGRMAETLSTRQAEQYQLEAKLGDKEKQLGALAAKVSRSDDLIDVFELNFKQVQQEVEELSAAFRMERDTGIVSLR